MHCRNLFSLALALLLITSCSSLGKRSSEPLPGRHAYSISTVQWESWIEFSCEKLWDHPVWALRGASRIRQIYSTRKSLTFHFVRENGARQKVELPGCRDVSSDGRFPERFFSYMKPWRERSCISEDGYAFLNSGDRNYRCWGDVNEDGYMVEYFYIEDSEEPTN